MPDPYADRLIDLEPEAFLERISQTQNPQILDLRIPEDYTYKHIPNAVNIEPTSFDFLQDVHDQLGASDTLFIYCRVGKPVGVGELLLENGYKMVYNLKGGSLAWEAYETAEARAKLKLKNGKTKNPPKSKTQKRKWIKEWYIGTC